MFALQKYGPSQASAQTGDRSLTEHEMKRLYIAWQDDVDNWMIPECLQQYRQLLEPQTKSWRSETKQKRQGQRTEDA